MGFGMAFGQDDDFAGHGGLKGKNEGLGISLSMIPSRLRSM